MISKPVPDDGIIKAKTKRRGFRASYCLNLTGHTVPGKQETVTCYNTFTHQKVCIQKILKFISFIFYILILNPNVFSL